MEGGGGARQKDRHMQSSGESKTDELLGEKTRGRGKGRWRWVEREQEQKMARGREVKQIGQEEERKQQWMRRMAHI